MRYALLAAFGIVLLFTTSCDKNDSDSPSGNRLDSITIRKIADNSVEAGIRYRYDNVGNIAQVFINNTLNTEFKYDAQNRMVSYSFYSPNSPTLVDTLIYTANSQTVQIYQYTAGTNTRLLVSKIAFDSKGRLTTDTTVNSAGISVTYFKYDYDNNDNVLSSENYSGSYSSNTAVSYYRADSTVYTYDGNENPYNKKSLANYYSGLRNFALSKNNILSRAVFQNYSTQTNNAGPHEVTYYKNGLVRTQIFGSSRYVPTRNEYLYK